MGSLAGLGWVRQGAYKRHLNVNKGKIRTTCKWKERQTIHINHRVSFFKRNVSGILEFQQYPLICSHNNGISHPHG